MDNPNCDAYNGFTGMIGLAVENTDTFDEVPLPDPKS
jgi:hypothetical protein